MKHDDDMELYHLFAEHPTPDNGERFVTSVSASIAHQRRFLSLTRILIICLGILVLAILQPWFAGLSAYILQGSSMFANLIAAAAISPLGWVIGWWIGLTMFLRFRS